ncbi:MAG: hypothetical protein HFJ44_01320 [Clostridia bacterium]|jgi:hypothetical protein|nr:hypothetical protein [Clostridia bacterium]
MSEPIGEMFIEGRIVNLDTESIENLEKILNEVSEKEEKSRDKLDNLMSKLISI